MKILDEIRNGESKILEFKSTLPSSESIAKCIIAFANTAGGKLIIGVDDDRRIFGLDDMDIFAIKDKISSIIYDMCYPNILPEIYTKNIDGKIILIIEVYRGNLLPYFLKHEGKHDGTYIRIGATNRKAGFENIMELERQRMNISYDEEINYEYSLADLDISPIVKKFSDKSKELNEQTLLNLKLIKQESGILKPTNGLVILLGLPIHTELFCARFKSCSQA